MKGMASLLGALGLVAFSFGLLSAMLALFNPASDLGWVIVNLVLGIVALGASAVLGFDSLRERMSSGEGRRAGRYGSTALVSTLLWIAILGMLAFLSTRYSTRFDWTEDKVHTLTGQTQDVLARLDRDVKVTAFFNELDAPWVRDLLQRYEYASDRFRVEFVDPNYRPDLVEALGIEEADLARGLVHMAVGDTTASLKEFSESEITNNLVKLTRSGEKKVYLIQGHNERSFEGEEGAGKEGYSAIVEALRNETYVVEPLMLTRLEAIPEDASAVIIAGPTRPYLEHEHGLLNDYLVRGGSLMVMIDPRAKTNLYEDLAGWGVELRDDVIVDQIQAVFNRATSPLTRDYSPHHPITLKLAEDPRGESIYPMVRSVRVLDGAPGSFEVVIFTGGQSWAEQDLDGWMASGRSQYDEDVDVLGPVPIAVAGELQLPGASTQEALTARLVVMGDSDFATNEFVYAGRNRDVLLNSVNWLVGDTEYISLRPNVARASRFDLTAEEFRTVQTLVLFVLPETIAVIGVFAWWFRRRGAEA